MMSCLAMRFFWPLSPPSRNRQIERGGDPKSERIPGGLTETGALKQHRNKASAPNTAWITDDRLKVTTA
jgi:hypothetical protein